MRSRALLCFALLLAMTAHAQEAPKILSVTPLSGPTSGGTEVEILGSGFTADCHAPITCLPPVVQFGDVRAAETRFVSATRLIAVTPPHFPGEYEVSYVSPTGATARFPTPFTFTGPVPEAQFERLLLPIFTPPVRGAFGSEFRTELRLAAVGGSFSTYGLRQNTAACAPVLCLDTLDPKRFSPNDDIGPNFALYNGNPGRFIIVPRNEMKYAAMNLRVADVSRASQNFGTEIPIVREHEFRSPVIELLGVPADRRFRNTLRIYSVDAPYVTVTVEGRAPVTVPLSEPASIFEPRYAVFTDFPASGFEPLRVTIAVPPRVAMPPLEPQYSFWAFVSVTNNETQMITTITPATVQP